MNVIPLRDLAYAQSRRPIPWFEQWVHGLQQALPWIAFAALVLLHWPQAAFEATPSLSERLLAALPAERGRSNVVPMPVSRTEDREQEPVRAYG